MGGVGQASKQLLGNAERIVMGVEEEAFENIEVASKTPGAIVNWMETFEVNKEGTEILNISTEPKLTEKENTVWRILICHKTFNHLKKVQ